MLLFCHAAGYFGRIWCQASLLLRSDWSRFALDFRGHGDSGPLPPGFTWRAFRDDVVDAAATIRPARLVGVGHSLGGTAALLAEAAFPGTFAAIVCFEPIFATAFDPQFALGAARRRARFCDRKEALARFSARPPLSALDPGILRDYVGGGLADEPDGGVRLRCSPEIEAQIYRTAWRSGWRAALPKIGCPVVFLFGTRSAVVDATSLADAAARMPDAKVIPVDGVGHLGPLEDPRAFARAVQAVLPGG